MNIVSTLRGSQWSHTGYKRAEEQVASATVTRFGLSKGLLGLQYDQINESEL